MPPPRPRPRAPTKAAAPDDPSTWPVRPAVSSGGVVVRPTEDGYEVALTKRRTLKGNEAWGLPKGGIEQGETNESAALREVREETGLEAEIVEPLPSITYWFAWPPDRARYRKTVHWYLMRMTGGDPGAHDDEVEEVRFVAFPAAVRMASYGSEKKILRKAAEIVTDW